MRYVLISVESKPFPMHEWALAEAVISTVSDLTRKEGLEEVTEIVIKVGELQQIEPDIFQFALSHLRTSELKNTRFRIEKDKAKLECRVCGRQWTLRETELEEGEREAIHFVPEIAHAYIRCPKCDSPDFEILQGRGVWIDSVKGMRRDG